MPDDLPAEAITAAASVLSNRIREVFTQIGGLIECNPITREMLEAAAPVIRAQAAAAERERLTLAILGCETCDQVHHPRQRCPGEPSHGQTWAAEDGHPYRSRIPFYSSVIREAVADLLREDTP